MEKKMIRSLYLRSNLLIETEYVLLDESHQARVWRLTMMMMGQHSITFQSYFE